MAGVPVRQGVNGEMLRTHTIQHHGTFTLKERYNTADSKVLGSGSFGVVITAYNSSQKCKVAVKRIRPYAVEKWDALHALREIRLMRLLGAHPNIISLYDLSVYEDKSEMYMVMEAMACDLHKLITRSKTPLTHKHFKCIMKQLFAGLEAMHAVGVLHRDLKPGNLLISQDCHLRITDFGLSRFVGDQATKNTAAMTQYVVTRWYRSPELLISPKHPYGPHVDIWSCGCILAEMMRRKPLFPGKSFTDQVYLILHQLGFSNVSELGIPVNEDNTKFLNKRCKFAPQNLENLFPWIHDKECLDMLKSLLTVNPNIRLTATKALEHNYLMKDCESLYDYSKPYLSHLGGADEVAKLFTYEKKSNVTLDELKSMINDEVSLVDCQNSEPAKDTTKEDPSTPVKEGGRPTPITPISTDSHNSVHQADSADSQDSQLSDTSSAATPVMGARSAPRKNGTTPRRRSKTGDSNPFAKKDSGKDSDAASTTSSIASSPTSESPARTMKELPERMKDGHSRSRNVSIADEDEMAEQVRQQMIKEMPVEDSQASLCETKLDESGMKQLLAPIPKDPILSAAQQMLKATPEKSVVGEVKADTENGMDREQLSLPTPTSAGPASITQLVKQKTILPPVPPSSSEPTASSGSAEFSQQGCGCVIV